MKNKFDFERVAFQSRFYSAHKQRPILYHKFCQFSTLSKKSWFGFCKFFVNTVARGGVSVDKTGDFTYNIKMVEDIIDCLTQDPVVHSHDGVLAFFAKRKDGIWQASLIFLRRYRMAAR